MSVFMDLLILNRTRSVQWIRASGSDGVMGVEAVVGARQRKKQGADLGTGLPPLQHRNFEFEREKWQLWKSISVGSLFQVGEGGSKEQVSHRRFLSNTYDNDDLVFALIQAGKY